MSNSQPVMLSELPRAQKCPHCRGAVSLATSAIEGSYSAPAVGSPAVCLECGQASVFGDRLVLRAMAEAELGHFRATDQFFAECYEICRCIREGARRGQR